MLLLVQLRWLRPSLQQITQNKTVLGIRHWHFYKEVAWAGKSGLKLYGNMIKDGKGALEIREKKCQWYSISIIPVISSRIPHFYNKCLRRIYQQNRLDVGGYTADHRSLALALVGKQECVHLLHVVDMERLICRCIDDKFIFHKYVLGRMPSNSCCCCPPASSWVQDLGGARGVTYCGRGSRHYSARSTLTIIWPLSPVSAPENEHFHSTVSFKLPHWQDSRLQIVMNSFMIFNFIFSILLLCSSAVSLTTKLIF